ncbi:hypothetical protein HAX54_021696 [Datura stramonium]|uniref:Uncharacterized protein n=1 Tax=Datura stramonium TaxID=4076 RepID=A0ABS8UV18_DATST|nr:hypothetical protein [Datura stramonium]
MEEPPTKNVVPMVPPTTAPSRGEAPHESADKSLDDGEENDETDKEMFMERASGTAPDSVSAIETPQGDVLVIVAPHYDIPPPATQLPGMGITQSHPEPHQSRALMPRQRMPP